MSLKDAIKTRGCQTTKRKDYIKNPKETAIEAYILLCLSQYSYQIKLKSFQWNSN